MTSEERIVKTVERIIEQLLESNLKNGDCGDQIFHYFEQYSWTSCINLELSGIEIMDNALRNGDTFGQYNFPDLAKLQIPHNSRISNFGGMKNSGGK